MTGYVNYAYDQILIVNDVNRTAVESQTVRLTAGAVLSIIYTIGSHAQKECLGAE